MNSVSPGLQILMFLGVVEFLDVRKAVSLHTCSTR